MTRRLPTIVLLSASTGYGHTKAGNSLQRELQRRLPGWSVLHDNLFEEGERLSYFSVERIWQTASLTPILRWLYSIFHRMVLSHPLLTDFVAGFFRKTGSRLAKRYMDMDIRLVVCLHPGAATACAYWKNQRDFILHVVATDLVVHGFHVGQGVDRVYCDRSAILASPSAVEFAATRRLVFTGLPIEVDFFRAGLEQRVSKNVLLTFGAKGLGAKRYISDLMHATRSMNDINLSIVCGTDRGLKRFADLLAKDLGLTSRCRVYGFVSNMSDLMRDAHIIVGKPGGITTGEVLASNRRLLVLGRLPGQEEYNLRVLQDLGRGEYCTARQLPQVLARTLLEDAEAKIRRLPEQGEQGVPAIATSILDSLSISGHLEPTHPSRVAV